MKCGSCGHKFEMATHWFAGARIHPNGPNAETVPSVRSSRNASTVDREQPHGTPEQESAMDEIVTVLTEALTDAFASEKEETMDDPVVMMTTEEILASIHRGMLEQYNQYDIADEMWIEKRSDGWVVYRDNSAVTDEDGNVISHPTASAAVEAALGPFLRSLPRSVGGRDETES
jgi:hypothetical protein